MKQRFLSLHSEHFEFKQELLKSQIVQIVALFMVGLFILIVNRAFPGFFKHPNLTWSVQLAVILKFWMLFAYAGFVSLLIVMFVGIESDYDDEGVFALGVLTSVLAGIWEEIGYRWLYICLAMVIITAMNWLLGTVFGTVVGVGFLILGIAMMFNDDFATKIPGLIVSIVGFFVLYIVWYKGYSNPIFWFYNHFTIPVVNFLTLGQFEMIFNNPKLSPLFVFGIISANASFRDGHKYQGSFGYVNSWVIGFIMMYAAISYGIGTAIALHIIYDIEIDIIHYISRKSVG